MRCQSTVGLSADEITEIVGRVERILAFRRAGRPPLMVLAEQVEMPLLSPTPCPAPATTAKRSPSAAGGR
ncbi:hypothetical protein FAIPA1_220044 [Frankia sp. AiPs1]